MSLLLQHSKTQWPWHHWQAALAQSHLISWRCVLWNCHCSVFVCLCGLSQLVVFLAFRIVVDLLISCMLQVSICILSVAIKVARVRVYFYLHFLPQSTEALRQSVTKFEALFKVFIAMLLLLVGMPRMCNEKWV